MKLDAIWIMYAVVFGGLGILLIALGSVMTGFLMCAGVLGWLFVANNASQLWIKDEDEEYEDD